MDNPTIDFRFVVFLFCLFESQTFRPSVLSRWLGAQLPQCHVLTRCVHIHPPLIQYCTCTHGEIEALM